MATQESGFKSEYQSDPEAATLLPTSTSTSTNTSAAAVGFFGAMSQRRRRVLALLFLVLIVAVITVPVVLLYTNSPAPASVQPLSFTNAAVASEEKTCSLIGSQVLQEGGTAVDAAIATALCIGVINNFASGIGGGGFMLVQGPDGSTEFFDFRETAPATAYQDMFVKNPLGSTSGGLASGVPGELKGMDIAHQRYGRLPWSRLFEPAIKLARDGFPATPLLVSRLQQITVLCQTDLLWGKVYAPNGALVNVGDLVVRTDLANTLQLIANNGSSDVFYYGQIAKDLVDDLNAVGGNISTNDFASYTAVPRVPLSTYYHGSKVLTGSPPSSGSVLIDILNILERYRLGETGPTLLTWHHIIEAMRFGFAQRSYLGDPDFVDMTAILNQMISKDFAALQRLNISDTHTLSPDQYGSDYDSPSTPGTTHISALDKSGYAASMTSTVNLVWGSKVMSRSGIILNNQMDDFSTPNQTNSFGLAPSPNNFIAPGKRPMSSAVPTIIRRDNQVQMVVGASGGTRIITATLLTILNNIDFKMNIQEAVNAPRLHDQLYPNNIMVEYDVSTTLTQGLEGFGHVIDRMLPGVTNSAVQAIVNGFDGFIYAASDPRKDGLAAGY